MAYSQCVRWFQCGLVVVATSHMATAVQAASLSDTQFQHRLLDEHPISFSESVFSNEGALVAQITPDETLGDEGSLFIEENNGIDRIGGGAIRGGNLFHSFQDFNIDIGQLVYFINPDGIETILSRVTGSNGSDIDGLLGVAGDADLFLFNPNGITFGPNAELDIRGAFTASTAGTLEFGDGGVFSAVNPQGASLLTMSAPLGVQFGALPQGDIFSTGVLATGEDLTLSSNRLYLEGQVIAGNDLTLQAQDTVTIRDTATDAFIARSGDELTVQGNQGVDIWTLQHLEQTPFVSGGNLVLISDGVISGDAHFESGGGLQFLTLAGLPGKFVSFHDPIIFADGDVVFGDYTGVALKVEATGSIQAGDIVITGPDTTLTADGSGSDEDLLASSRAAILRAGVDSVSDPNVPQTEGGTTFRTEAVVGQSLGSITISGISTSVINGDGGPIILTASNDITVGGLGTGGGGFDGDGGDISITTISGDITINGALSSPSDASSYVGGDGGDISITTISGDITINDYLDSSTSTGSSPSPPGIAGKGGDISISSISGNITIKSPLSSVSVSLSPGGPFLSSAPGIAGDGGDISVSSNSGDIIINESLSSASSAIPGNSGNGGNISISSNSGNITTDFLSSTSTTSSDDSGNGGNIFISSNSGNITTNGRLRSFSGSSLGNSGNGGSISILSSNSSDIIINESLSSGSFAFSGNAGKGGDIFILKEEGNIIGNKIPILAFSVSPSVGAISGEGGVINLEASTISGLEIFTLSNAGASGNVLIRGSEENLTINDLSLITSGQVSVPDPFGVPGQTISLNLSDFGQAGKTVITSTGNLLLNEVEIRSDANRSTNAGNVEVLGAGNIRFNSSQILSNANIESSGNGGSIIVSAMGDVTFDNSLINTNTEGSGRAGSIRILTPLLNLQNGTRVTAETNSSMVNSTGGDITIEANELNLSGNDTEITVKTNGSAPGGNIILQSLTNGSIAIVSINDGPQITASTTTNSTGSGGNITIQNVDTALLDNTELLTSGDGSGTAGSIFIQNVGEFVMRRGSLILAVANETGSGGNVDIDAVFIFTVPEEDNDILATANFGQGGTVDITANLIIGFREVEQFSPDLRGNSISDISAQSNFGLDGIVNLDADPNPE